MKIKKVEAIEILDSRGNPTVEVDIRLENGQRPGYGAQRCLYRGKRSGGNA
jgi:enolase